MRRPRLQSNEPDRYFGKTITTYGFVVTNHLLETKYDGHMGTEEYEISVVIMLSEGRVIGGYSFPVKKDGVLLAGGVYSMEGDTQEEMTGLTYSEWLDMWMTRYGE